MIGGTLSRRIVKVVAVEIILIIGMSMFATSLVPDMLAAGAPATSTP